jgi:predicted GNAT family acetyltransferase
VESDIRDNSAMSRFEMPVGDGAIAVAYYKVEDDRVVLLHTEVPQELSGQGYGSNWRMAFSNPCDAMGKE